MDFERIKKAWQDEDERIVLNGDIDAMLARTRRRQKRLYAQLIFSDVLETSTALIMAGVMIWLAQLLSKAPRLLYLSAGSLMLLAIFFIADRLRQEWGWQPRTTAEELRHYIKRVDRRISLLRNVFWWYLLPTSFAWLMFMTALFLETRPGWQTDFWSMFTVFGSATALAIGAFTYTWFINQWAVQDDLVPLRLELERVLDDLTEEQK